MSRKSCFLFIVFTTFIACELVFGCSFPLTKTITNSEKLNPNVSTIHQRLAGVVTHQMYGGDYPTCYFAFLFKFEIEEVCCYYPFNVAVNCYELPQKEDLNKNFLTNSCSDLSITQLITIFETFGNLYKSFNKYPFTDNFSNYTASLFYTLYSRVTISGKNLEHSIEENKISNSKKHLKNFCDNQFFRDKEENTSDEIEWQPLVARNFLQALNDSIVLKECIYGNPTLKTRSSSLSQHLEGLITPNKDLRKKMITMLQNLKDNKPIDMGEIAQLRQTYEDQLQEAWDRIRTNQKDINDELSAVQKMPNVFYNLYNVDAEAKAISWLTNNENWIEEITECLKGNKVTAIEFHGCITLDMCPLCYTNFNMHQYIANYLFSQPQFDVQELQTVGFLSSLKQALILKGLTDENCPITCYISSLDNEKNTNKNTNHLFNINQVERMDEKNCIY